MTINEANLLLTLFFTQHEGKRLCDVIQDCQNDSIIYEIKKYSHNKNLIITDNHTYYEVGYVSGYKDYDYFFYCSHGYQNSKNEEVEFDITQYITFEDKI